MQEYCVISDSAKSDWSILTTCLLYILLVKRFYFGATLLYLNSADQIVYVNNKITRLVYKKRQLTNDVGLGLCRNRNRRNRKLLISRAPTYRNRNLKTSKAL